MEQQEELFDDLRLSGAAGGRKPSKSVDLTVVRHLGLEDLDALIAGEAPKAPQPGNRLLSIRHAHHQIARLLTSGSKQAEVSLLTGYSPAYISILQKDPAFRELLAYYTAQEEAKHVDVMERMRSLGLSTLDELQRRLEEEPDDWKKGELMNLAELMLVKPHAAGRSASSGGGSATGNSGVAISVSFVTATPVPDASGVTIDISPNSED